MEEYIIFAKWINKNFRYKHENLLFRTTFELDYGDVNNSNFLKCFTYKKK